MTAVFVASNQGDEFARYQSALSGRGFTKHDIAMIGLSNAHPVYVRMVGEDSCCIVCKSFARGSGSMLDLRVQDVDEARRLNAFFRDIAAVINAVGAQRKHVRIFLHNGKDVPKGYEAWVNSKFEHTTGYEGWSLSMLSRSGARKDVFCLTKISFSDNLENAELFDGWIEKMAHDLQTAGEVTQCKKTAKKSI